CQHYYSPPFSF
nr:immunoglobulin light chain junction region [Macaca mulatta]MOV74463.1 immunoglobulin light chain junction region [Macaca mulatta]MOV74909.1 immunoglobulin light chain junction region [Macaca mulatta]MOV75020.1 immunoglobulin light chain junction region [Macaca mulatta]MOV75074.1 immunoglobulin light chain junction region [Macaca mulatta]